SLYTIPLPPRSPLFPYTTLFRSGALLVADRVVGGEAQREQVGLAALAKPLFVHRALGEGLEQVVAERAAVDGAIKGRPRLLRQLDRKSTRLNSSHVAISYAVFCL